MFYSRKSCFNRTAILKKEKSKTGVEKLRYTKSLEEIPIDDNTVEHSYIGWNRPLAKQAIGSVTE